jgi:carbon-monoxide dehydrogenase iron sulfur subunit
MKKLKFNPDKCTACKLCELACSAHHESVFNPELARIHIHARYTKDGYDANAEYCNQCLLCVEVCPCNAIKVGENGLEFNPVSCSKCGVCVEECPRGIITQRPDELIRICDMCGGNPQCVEWCPKDALQLEGEEK